MTRGKQFDKMELVLVFLGISTIVAALDGKIQKGIKHQMILNSILTQFTAVGEPIPEE
jgi:hypothetical protein